MWIERLIYIRGADRATDGSPVHLRTHPIVWLQNCIFLHFFGVGSISVSLALIVVVTHLSKLEIVKLLCFPPPSNSHSINNNYKTIEIFQIVMASQMYRLSKILKGLVISTWNIFLWLKWAGQCPVGEPFPHSSEIDTVSVKIEK